MSSGLDDFGVCLRQTRVISLGNVPEHSADVAVHEPLGAHVRVKLPSDKVNPGLQLKVTTPSINVPLISTAPLIGSKSEGQRISLNKATSN